MKSRKDLNLLIAELTGESFHRLDKIGITLSNANQLTSGVVTSADVAKILTGLLGSSSVPESVESVKVYGCAKAKEDDICGLQSGCGTLLFGKTLSMILNKPSAANLVKQLKINHVNCATDYCEATITWEKEKGIFEDVIFTNYGNTNETPVLTKQTTLNGSVLYKISEELAIVKDNEWSI